MCWCSWGGHRQMICAKEGVCPQLNIERSWNVLPPTLYQGLVLQQPSIA
ncbi:hypothetical protein LPH55_05910 [Xylella taiwanensis]|uniref:Transposase n=1 Tax=Xylella taiwanensis TaxID=1444770 RepID=A0ABS8TSD6_9GAMM|nr:hypothetical protein [Xylella taiwanensis]MCD8473007.1 hypothetical protein [Xylella taiwanensis]